MSKINESDLEWTEYDPEPDDVAFRRKELATAVDADELGCSLYELPSGMRSWPYHYHTANEEALYVLAGEGLLVAADGETSLTAGDYVAFPADESGGHRIVNDGDDSLRYLMVSTMNEPDVTVYPETEKFGVYVGSPRVAARNGRSRGTIASTTSPTGRETDPTTNSGIRIGSSIRERDASRTRRRGTGAQSRRLRPATRSSRDAGERR